MTTRGAVLLGALCISVAGNVALLRAGAEPSTTQSKGSSTETEPDVSVETRSASRSTLADVPTRLASRARLPRLPDRPSSKQSGQDKRLAVQEHLRAFFGRDADETPTQYRERLVPIVAMALSGPRDEQRSLRDALSRRVDLGDSQLDELDGTVGQAHQEILDMTNASIAAGDLSPYERNWSGVMTYVGGFGSILDVFEARVAEILSPEQLEEFYAAGFEWGEYLAITTPWEQLDAPPPDPSSPGADG